MTIERILNSIKDNCDKILRDVKEINRKNAMSKKIKTAYFGRDECLNGAALIKVVCLDNSMVLIAERNTLETIPTLSPNELQAAIAICEKQIDSYAEGDCPQDIGTCLIY